MRSGGGSSAQAATLFVTVATPEVNLYVQAANDSEWVNVGAAGVTDTTGLRIEPEDGVVALSTTNGDAWYYLGGAIRWVVSA